MTKFLSLAVALFILVSGAGWSMEFNEAPWFAEQVERGELPPVEERVPKDAYIVEPIDSIGTYGGTLRASAWAAGGGGDDTLVMTWPSPVKQSPDLAEFTPHVLKDLTVSEDATVWTMHMREGMRWSDGELFTADDIMFWYESVLLNEDLTPVVGDLWRAEGEVMEMVRLDDYTVDVRFAGPRPFFDRQLVHTGRDHPYVPKHFLKDYHPDYVDMEELQQRTTAAGFDNWYEYFGHVNNVQGAGLSFFPARPTITAYIAEELSSSRRIWRPNPYFWKVDSEGNQLPYLEQIEGEIVADPEVVQGMIMSGDLDFAGFQSDIRNYPLYQSYAEEADIRTVMWESGMSSEVVYMVNMTHEEPELREIFQNPDFRKALSLGIDRQEINDVIYFGQAVPKQYTVLETSVYFEEEFATAYADYDMERATALLDGMGLDEKDGEGFRLRPDGARLSFEIEYVDRETPKTPNVELVAAYWQELGLDVRYRAISGELAGERAPANVMDATLWHGDAATDVLFPMGNSFLIPRGPGWSTTHWPEWGRWVDTGGEAGEEPPQEIKDLRGWYEQMLVESDPEVSRELGRKILQSQAENLWVIGTVGNAPYPVVLNKDLRNFPETGFWGWDSLWVHSQDPEQLYFDR